MRRVVRTLVVALIVLLLGGCGSGVESRADVPPVQPSHADNDPELVEAGVDAQLVQSLSETAQSAGYERDRDALTSWRTSLDLARRALHRCRADAEGRRTFPQYVADDEKRGVAKDAAVRVNRFIEQEFCAALAR